jgi:uncharacterized membrane protein
VRWGPTLFLSTFVMISQNRADDKRSVLANQQSEMVQDDDKQNEELLRLSYEIPRADEGAPRSHGRLH